MTVKTKIVFVTLFEFTETYHQIAQRLYDSFDVYYVTSTKTTNIWLKNHGVDPSRILDLSKTRQQVRSLGKASPELLSYIVELERFGPTFDSIIMMSRFYRGENPDFLLHYMGKMAQQLESYFVTNGIEWVIAEPTNAVELIAYQVSAKLSINAGQISLPRLPQNRIILFKDVAEREFYELAPVMPFCDESESGLHGVVLDWLMAYRKDPERPPYFKNQSKPRSILDLLKSTVRRLLPLVKELYGNTEVNSNTFWEQTVLYGRRYLGGLRKYGIPDQSSGKFTGKFAIYFLQVQPERSVDVLSPFFSNQLELIKNIRRATPSDHRLLIKDHPSIYGMQKLSFYRELATVPGVTLISSGHDSRRLIRAAAFVATISGTVAFEAALLNVPALIFSKVFFRDLPLVYECSNPDELSSLISNMINCDFNSIAVDRETTSFLINIWTNSVVSAWDATGYQQAEEIIESFANLLTSAVKANER